MSYIGNEPIVSATRTVTEITATAGQTVFTANGGYTVGYIDVFVNGAQLQSADFTATNGSTVVLTQAAQVGDVVRLVAWGTFSSANITSGSLSAGGITWSQSGGVTLPRIDSSNEGGQLNFNRASDNTATWSIDSFGNTSTPSLRFIDGANVRAVIDGSGNVGIGTSSPAAPLDVVSNSGATGISIRGRSSDNIGVMRFYSNNGATQYAFVQAYSSEMTIGMVQNSPMTFYTNNTERMRIDSSGNLFVGKTSNVIANGGFAVIPSDGNCITKTVTSSFSGALVINRAASVGDGVLVEFLESGTAEGTISVSGTTVSYNGGHLSRWAQTIGAKDETLLKGTVLSNLDEMNEYVDAEGNPVDNEQLNKVKVSDVEGDVNVAGVFVNWSYDEAHNVDEINMAMTGDMIIRIAQGVVVQKGDLLMSAGDGTAKPQGDDVVRSKTIAKVTSTHITCTYEDGSYCVPCVLMAC